jgi:hypothetical protein
MRIKIVLIIGAIMCCISLKAQDALAIQLASYVTHMINTNCIVTK